MTDSNTPLVADLTQGEPVLDVRNIENIQSVPRHDRAPRFWRKMSEHPDYISDEAQTALDLIDAGGGSVSAIEEQLIANFIGSQVDSGNWAAVEAFHLECLEDSAARTIDLITGTNLTVDSTPTTPVELSDGLQYAIGNSVLTGWNPPATDVDHFVSIAMGRNHGVTSNGRTWTGGPNMRLRRSGDQYTGVLRLKLSSLNYNEVTTPNLESWGLYTCTRDSGGPNKIFLNGTEIDSVTAGSFSDQSATEVGIQTSSENVGQVISVFAAGLSLTDRQDWDDNLQALLSGLRPQLGLSVDEYITGIIHDYDSTYIYGASPNGLAIERFEYDNSHTKTTLVADINSWINDEVNTNIISSICISESNDVMLVVTKDIVTGTFYIYSSQLDGTIRNSGNNVYSGIYRALGHQSFWSGTFQSAASILWGQYGNPPAAGEACYLKRMVSPWTSFTNVWQVSDQTPSAGTPFRHIHSVSQNPYAVNTITVCLGDSDAACAIIQGPDTNAANEWDTHDDATATTIAADANFDVLHGEQKHKNIGIAYANGRGHYCPDAVNDLGGGGDAGNGIFSFLGSDMSELARQYYGPRFNNNDNTDDDYIGSAGTTVIKLDSGGLVAIEWLEAAFSKGEQLYVYTSRDGKTWIPAGYFNLNDDGTKKDVDGFWTVNVEALWSFVAGGKLYISGSVVTRTGVSVDRYETPVISEADFNAITRLSPE